MTPRIHVYTICWNEERFLPYFLRHYGAFAEEITVFDNGSDDNSVAIARAFPNTRVESYDSGNEIRDDLYLQIKNTCWQRSRGRADWVICVDADELVWHANVPGYLASCARRGITLPVPSGYDMVADTFPTTAGQVYEEVKCGAFTTAYCKPCVFDPDAIEAINYEPGAHTANPRGRVVADPRSDLKLLHYRFLGLDYVLPRYFIRNLRRSAINRQQGWGSQYALSQAEIIEGIGRLKRGCIQVVP